MFPFATTPAGAEAWLILADQLRHDAGKPLPLTHLSPFLLTHDFLLY